MRNTFDYAPQFPIWKKAFIEGWRVFFAAFIAVIAAQLQAGVNIMQWQVWLRSLIISAAVAGLKAVFKWSREKYGTSYDQLIFKLPI